MENVSVGTFFFIFDGTLTFLPGIFNLTATRGMNLAGRTERGISLSVPRVTV